MKKRTPNNILIIISCCLLFFILLFLIIYPSSIPGNKLITYGSIESFEKCSHDIPYYEMYDAYQFIIKNKKELLRDNHFLIFSHNDEINNQYSIEDFRSSIEPSDYTIDNYFSVEGKQPICSYEIYYEKLDIDFESNTDYQKLDTGELYIKKSEKFSILEVYYLDTISFTLNIYLEDYENSEIEDYIPKIIEYIKENKIINKGETS